MISQLIIFKFPRWTTLQPPKSGTARPVSSAGASHMSPRGATGAVCTMDQQSKHSLPVLTRESAPSAQLVNVSCSLSTMFPLDHVPSRPLFPLDHCSLSTKKIENNIDMVSIQNLVING